MPGVVAADAVVDAREELERLAASTKRGVASRSSGRAKAEYSPGEVHLADEGRHPVAEAAVDRLLGGPQERERLTALVDVVELGAHQGAQDSTAPVRRVGPDDRDARGRDDAARNREPEREGAGAADDAAVLPGGVHALDREVLREALHPLLGRIEPEVLPDREDRLPELLEVGAGRDPERHAIFSNGAYSTISLRSDPSYANRTVTTPPGSMPVTIPSPSEPWRTASPVESEIPGRCSIAALAGEP